MKIGILQFQPFLNLKNIHKTHLQTFARQWMCLPSLQTNLLLRKKRKMPKSKRSQVWMTNCDYSLSQSILSIPTSQPYQKWLTTFSYLFILLLLFCFSNESSQITCTFLNSNRFKCSLCFLRIPCSVFLYLNHCDSFVNFHL